MCNHFNQWEKIDWKEEEKSQCSVYILPDLFDVYKQYPGDFTNSIIELGVLAMPSRPKNFLADSGVDGFWRSYVMAFLGTDFMKTTNEQLTVELNTMLERVSSTKSNKDPELLNHLLNHHPVRGKLHEYLSEKLNPYYSQNNISEVAFLVFGPLLPDLGSNMTDDTARGLVAHLITPIYKLPSCAKIIVEKHDFYFSILKQAKDVAQSVLKEMLTCENTSEFYSSFEANIRELIILDESQET